ncbi:MAG: hypothetical protein A3C30_02720 [Candidatus Levybacteria bacterium RIFCSPHIGHO2_02_FULL_40_18]|nr:MAG: hypothetical protein A2869_05255 [Candidatus Levybacteria bacterium RIFCSPHIGHO2_01_FULL_40_58]OGH26889.1 MAG: hypothetical protein A3C30_02720 [Candidatus Levybacteria bacterium RIFCSPHIGHO2_02_FULL_40_18]OGH32011.1 MAG: hypothetical protein A3E43_03700 [Candidatus Levybacteria bacterium RIFCSPHIGHO2_12_FULL_40_31]OGH40867.1 MAG: hypothetical protein A2894_04700 [Candidatus Levybacteria bacterium RIFCSPLOWO2_01_FULL_40_64]OGH52788.1 MAG: hypothetical protein A3G15_00450 [Candidatus Lev
MAAKFSGNPLLAVGASFVSHFVADVVPHWDSGTHWRKKTKERLRREAIIDVLVGFILSYILYSLILQKGPPMALANYPFVFLCIIAAQAPDWLTAPSWMFGKDFPGSSFMYEIQHRLNVKLDKPWGIITQILALIWLYLILFVIF